MGSNPAPKKGSGGKRKIGRMARKPSHNRYTMEARWEKNKARRIAKEAKRAAKKSKKKAQRESE